MFKRVLLSVWTLMIGFAASYGQTTIIGPATNNGGFEDAANTAWQFVNGTQVNQWVISTGATAGFSGTKAAYVSNNTTAPYAHNFNTSSTSTVHLYQDVTLPAALPVVNLSFKKIVGGESSYDFLAVYISNGAPGGAPVAGTPAGGYNPGLMPAITGYTALGGYNLVGSSWTTTNIPITAAQAGNSTVATTRRILFVWSNDGSGGVQPPAGIDDVLLTAACSGPIGLNATAITTNSATLNWTALTGATGYNVRYKKVSDPITVLTWATPTTVGAGVTSLAITGLTALSTQYEFQVSANGPVCNNYNASATFTTQCGFATLPYTETFESIAANNQLPSCMAATNLGSKVYTFTAPLGYANAINHTPGGSKFASFYYNANDWLFTPLMNLTAGTNYKFSFWYITDGATGWDSLKVGMGSSQTAAAMTQQFTIATNVTNTTYALATQNFVPTTTGNYSFGIKVKSGYNYTYLTVDDINVVELLPCTGTPLAEVISPSNGTACPAATFTINSNGANNGAGGVSYQWQSASSASGPWTNIAGATNGNSYSQTGISATSYFRLQATCIASALTSTSNTATITVNSFINCYCNSAATQTADEDIGQFTLGTFANPVAAPSPLLGNPNSTNLYTDFTTSVAPIPLAKGVSTPLSITQINSGTYFYSSYAKVYIDYNQNGSFTDPGEEVFGDAATGAAAPTYSGSITVPNTAVAGLTRLRVIIQEFGSATGVTPCGTYGYGETEDYLVSIPGTPPPPTVTNNGPVCAGGTATITAVSSTLNPSYTISGGGAPTVTNTTGVFVVPTPSAGATVTYSVVATAYGFTSAPATTTVTLFPTAAISAGSVINPTTCAGADGSIQITGAANSTVYTLRYNRNGINVNPGTITTTATGTYTISNLNVATYDSIRVINANGCVSNKLGPISLVPPAAPPPPAATYDQPLCLNTTLTLRATNPIAGAIYNWYGPGGYTSTGAVATRLNVSYADTGNYGVTVNIGGCVSGQNTFKVYITPPSPVPTTAPISLCQNSSPASLTANGTSLLFYSALTGGTGSATLVPATTTLGNSTYYVTQTSNGCESRPRVPLVVTIKSTPGAPSVPNGGNIIQCQFDAPATLPVTGVSGATFLYYTTATGGTGSATLTPRNDTVGVLNYYVSQSLNGCESPRTAYIVTTKAKPAPPTVVSPLNICQFAIVGPLTATGQNINWYENPAGGVPLLSPPVPETNIPTPKAGIPVRDSFFATQTVNGCESDRSLIDVSINYQPNATFIPSKRFVCVDDTISFVYYGNADNNATYNWFVPKPQGRDVSGQNSQGPFVARFDSIGVYDVRLIVSSDKGCVSTPVTQRVEVRDRPQTRITAKREICIDEVVEISLDSMSEQISSYNFTFDGGKVEYATYDAGPFGVSWNTPGAKQVIVNSTSRSCGSRIQAEVINVRPAPYAVIQNKPTQNVCAGDSLRLQANDLGPGYIYTWTPSKIFQDRGNRGTTVFTTPLFNGAVYAAVLSVTDSVGCIGKDSVDLHPVPCCNIIFPNAFTPNNDGLNDRFGMKSIGVPGRFTMRVMNRWGKVMFETSDALETWDGSFSGQEQPSGTYFFYAKYRCSNGQDYEQKGEITLIR